MNKQLIYLFAFFIILLLGGTVLLNISRAPSNILLFKNQKIHDPDLKQTPTKQNGNIVINQKNIPEPREIEAGTIQGNLCYPSEILPAGRIIAKDINTNQIYENDYQGAPPLKSSEYSIYVPPGNYYLKYQVGLDEKYRINGYHTSCEGESNCNEPSSHILTPVEVKSGQTAEGIKICDFYYQPDQEPEF